MTLASPVRGPLIRTGGYGLRKPGAGGTDAPAEHKGVDIRAAAGTPVFPIEPGRVVEVRRSWRSLSFPGPIEGERIFTNARAGNLVVVRGKSGDVDYGHLHYVDGAVSVGDDVGLDTRLGASGATGVKQPHLHVGIHTRTVAGGKTLWTPRDPTDLLPWDGYVTTTGKVVPLTPPTTGGFMAHLTEDEQQELLETVRATRRSQITPQGYTYDAALLGLVQGLYRELAKVSPQPIDTAAIAAQLRADLGDDVGDDVVDALLERIRPR